jgi:hypothetical protein
MAPLPRYENDNAASKLLDPNSTLNSKETAKIDTVHRPPHLDKKAHKNHKFKGSARATRPYMPPSGGEWLTFRATTRTAAFYIKSQYSRTNTATNPSQSLP